MGPATLTGKMPTWVLTLLEHFRSMEYSLSPAKAASPISSRRAASAPSPMLGKKRVNCSANCSRTDARRAAALSGCSQFWVRPMLRDAQLFCRRHTSCASPPCKILMPLCAASRRAVTVSPILESITMFCGAWSCASEPETGIS